MINYNSEIRWRREGGMGGAVPDPFPEPHLHIVIHSFLGGGVVDRWPTSIKVLLIHHFSKIRSNLLEMEMGF